MRQVTRGRHRTSGPNPVVKREYKRRRKNGSDHRLGQEGSTNPIFTLNGRRRRRRILQPNQEPITASQRWCNAGSTICIHNDYVLEKPPSLPCSATLKATATRHRGKILTTPPTQLSILQASFAFAKLNAPALSPHSAQGCFILGEAPLLQGRRPQQSRYILSNDRRRRRILHLPCPADVHHVVRRDDQSEVWEYQHGLGTTTPCIKIQVYIDSNLYKSLREILSPIS